MESGKKGVNGKMSLQTFQVLPNVPERLSFLEVISRNMWWCWQYEAISLFRRMSPKLWIVAKRNPILFLGMIPQGRMEELARDEGFLAHLDQVESNYNEVLAGADASLHSSLEEGETIAYFSMEFGLHESLPLFSGGLGVLAGDHLKAASDLNLPITGIGLLYRQGFFHQFLNRDGWQQEAYPEADIYNLPVTRVQDKIGNNIEIMVNGPKGPIKAICWKVMVGVVPLYLLDTNLPENSPEIREITGRLYGGDPVMRLNQEALLGIGGVRLLDQLGLFPVVCHMNEGHSAFSAIERLALTMSRYDLDLRSAMEINPRITVFTTHTPVAAGHDEFPPDLVRPVLKEYEDIFGIKVNEIISWGQDLSSSPGGVFSMFILSLRHAEYINGVSRLHGKVARKMWSGVWPGWPEDEVPISHITNGVHLQSWLAHELSRMLDHLSGPDWRKKEMSPEIIRRIDEVYDEELWRAHEVCRSRLIRLCRNLIKNQYLRRNAAKAVMEEVETVLEHDVLTICFGRRFATYKRAYLLFMDLDRLEKMLSSSTRPVQLIFAGKAHPMDNEGKELIKNVISIAREPRFRQSIVFLEDYDLDIARFLVQGADVWLNTPRRPYEACGTSGMKASLNGVLNLSVPDGWWDEGYTSERGWSIGKGEEYTDLNYQDAVESQALYNLLENEVIPTFYNRQGGDAPADWVRMMKESMKMAFEEYTSVRMVKDYQEKYYDPIISGFRELIKGGADEARALYEQKKRLKELWNQVKLSPPVRKVGGPSRVGQNFDIWVKVELGQLKPEEIRVELYYGHVLTLDELEYTRAEPMSLVRQTGEGRYEYSSTIYCRDSGRFGFTVRAVPNGDDYLRYTPGLITWA
jgi:starch phosphorylase